MSVPAAPKLVGARVPRREDPRLLTGQGSYVDDHRPARMLYAAFLRAPHPHARIARIDAGAARAEQGVTAVLTGEEIARDTKPVRAVSRMSGYKATSFPPLAQGKVRYTGEAVAIESESTTRKRSCLLARMADLLVRESVRKRLSRR